MPTDLPAAVQTRENRLLAIRLPNPNRPVLQTLREERYRTASRVWDSVVPVVHARRRTSTGPRGAYRQVAADCVFAGLPEPASVEILTEAPFGGAPSYLLPDRMIPADWTGPLQGPRSHVRITFDRPVIGPLLLGKARHFGVGLCLPNRELDRKLTRDTEAPEPDEPVGTSEAVVA
jgi:CRISPR-associated protein Csb2